MVIFLWILIGFILYTYFGYTLCLIILNGIKNIFFRTKPDPFHSQPELTLLIAAFNEADLVDIKMANTKQINYPSQKIKILWITDGSTDKTTEKLKQYPEITVLHQPVRMGKTHAINRAMTYVETPITIFCDANTMLNADSIRLLVLAFNKPKVGCVAGEKRIATNLSEAAAGAGEGIYWSYESFLKKQESDFSTTLGAAGELYAIRTKLFQPVLPDSIIDDFVISMKIAQQGYKIEYVPGAFAQEEPSLNIREELKRKIRIASGGIQTLLRYPQWLNIFKYGFLSVGYLSHKIFRWTLVPFAIPIVFILNCCIFLINTDHRILYGTLLICQIFFYLLVVLGGLLKNKNYKFSHIFLPYYLIIMNYAQIAGIYRYLTKSHSVIWEKSKRSSHDKIGDK